MNVCLREHAPAAAEALLGQGMKLDGYLAWVAERGTMLDNRAREILEEKGVTYRNIVPDPEGDFYKDFVADISTYPTTYIVDSEGNIVGADIVGNVKKQLDTVEARLALITGQK